MFGVQKAFQKMVGVFKTVDISNIDISKYNARDIKLEAKNSPGFVDLCDSIDQVGVVEPLIVREISKGDYETVAGSRRLRALKTIGAVQVPVIIRNDLTDIDVRIFSLVENIQRKHLEEDEIQDCLASIYKDSADHWKPANLTAAEKLIIDKHGYSELAKSYLKRIHNEQSGVIKSQSSEKSKANDYKNVLDQSNKQNKGSFKQEINPTEEFRILAKRLTYAYSTQYNILRGYGSFRVDQDYLAELPPDIQKIIEEQVQQAIESDKALKEHEKLEKEKELKQKSAWKYQTRTKTKKKETEKAERGRKKASETKEKKKPTKAEQALSVTRTVIKKDKEEQQAKKTEAWWSPGHDDDLVKANTRTRTTQTAPKLAISPVRARDKIVSLCSELFVLLTAQELNMNDLTESQRVATSKQAKDNMNALAAFYADPGDRGLQQHVIIPTNKAISEYKDILYQAVQNARKQDDLAKP